MLNVNANTSPCSLKRGRKVHVIAAGLLLAVAFVGCQPGPEVPVVRRTVSSYSSYPPARPADADPVRAAALGREMLEKIGYARLIDLARQAGYVTTKTRRKTPRNDGAVLAMDGAAPAVEFVEVFSRYALVAGVTSQADTPLPGPADLAALGILALGLLDAGILQGALWDSLTDTQPPGPLAASTATAAPTTTVTAPPIPATRRRPGQTCDDARLKELEKQKDAACSIQWSCSDSFEKIGTKYEKLLTCPELLARIPIGKACIAARKLVQSECFAGSPEPGHEEAIEGLTKGLNECMKKKQIRGPGGGPC